jgi:hypothetical protein
MKRRSWGIAIAVLAIICFFGDASYPSGVNATVVGIHILLMATGLLLIYYGEQSLKEKKAVVYILLCSLRDEANIDAREIAGKMGIREATVRRYITESQRTGEIPFRAEIV